MQWPDGMLSHSHPVCQMAGSDSKMAADLQNTAAHTNII